MQLLSVFVALSFALPYVAAHGFISKVTIDGKAYVGNVPGDAKDSSPVRLISTIDPVKGASNSNLFCGQSPQLAALVANANPGSNISLQWMAGGGETWPHNTGPILVYMTSTGSSTADKFNSPTDAAWFKIDEAGKKPNDPSTWVQQDIMNGQSYSFQLPDNLAAGDYLLRPEIVALHLATSMGGAEFYPGCVQLRVDGSQTGKPKSSDTVQLPGAYKDNDPGIFVPNVYDSGLKYQFPGPEVATLASSGDASSPSAPSASNPKGTSSASATASSTGAKSTSSGTKSQCKLKKRGTDNATTDDDSASASSSDSLYVVNHPRHFSRVMRRLLNTS